MSTSADKLLQLNAIKTGLFAASVEKGLDTTGRTLENLHELWGGISGGGALQAKTAVPSNVDVEVTPDDGYDALSAVTIAEALNLKPWNIRKGKTLFGVTGTADIAVTTEVPSDIPVSKDDADTAYEEAVGEAPKDEDGSDLDMMTLADDNGNITYGYFLQGAANGSANGTCLYNGVELPDIESVWTDKETYPYAFIKDTTANTRNPVYYLILSPSVATYNPTTGIATNASNPGGWMQYICKKGATEWTYSAVSAQGSFSIHESATYPCLWASEDILSADGTVFLAASDPIPLNYNTIIRWDGNTEGRSVIEIGDGLTMVKASDSVMTADEMRNCVIGITIISSGKTGSLKATDLIADGIANVVEDSENGVVALNTYFFPYVASFSNADVIAELGGETGTYILAQSGLQYVHLLAYNPASPSGFTITSYDPITTNFSAVGWRRLSYHTTGELAGQWTYDDFSTTASSGGNFLKNIVQCSREKLYYKGVEVWPVPFRNATWETLFDGTVKTSYIAPYLHLADLARPSPTLGYVFAEGDVIKITVNGTSNIFVAEKTASGVFYVGNYDVYNQANSDEFDGYPYFVKASMASSGTNYLFRFASRESGTYAVTIEKEVR